jgi:hypothetical protein
MELQNILSTINVETFEIEQAFDLSKKIGSFGPMHLVMILVD